MYTGNHGDNLIHSFYSYSLPPQAIYIHVAMSYTTKLKKKVATQLVIQLYFKGMGHVYIGYMSVM